MLDLNGRTAFITGGSRGIGLGIARALAKRGVKLALADIDEVSLQAAHSELSQTVETRTYVLDVSDRVGYARVAEAVAAELGPVTLLFNNAGIIDSAPPRQMSYAMYDYVMGINLNGVYNGFQTFVPAMIDGGIGGHVVSTSSEAGLTFAGSGYLYHASKYAVVGMSESMRAELASQGIGVSVLIPGPVATDIVQNTRRLRPESAPEQSKKVTAILDHAHAALNQYGTPADAVGELVVDAVVNNLPYVHTRNGAKELVEARTAAIVEAMDHAQAFLDARAIENRVDADATKVTA